jgi:molybdopterin/thiamine biosynthesis adenylyltransferase
MHTTDQTTVPVREASWFKRLEGVLPQSISQMKVGIVGCGSVGSFIADELTRAGVSDYLLIDPDIVEWANLTRTVYRHADVGTQKVEALARHLREIFPDVRAEPKSCELQALREHLPNLLAPLDLVISAVDDPKAAAILDRYCYHFGIPVVFVGIYKGAKGGEVITIDPARTPCLACATGGVRDSLSDVTDTTQVVRDRDYGTNKLIAEVALGSDIHFISAAAVKIALSVLTQGTENLALSKFASAPMNDGVHYLMLGTEPGYYIFPATHAHAVGQHAFQAVWLQTTRRPECPRCGDAAHREPPV